jgi:hypothetical protein
MPRIYPTLVIRCAAFVAGVLLAGIGSVSP